MNYTPEQLREDAAFWEGTGEHTRAAELRAFAAALEEIEQLKADNAVLRRQIRQMDDTGAPRGWSDVVEASINRAESAEAELAKLKAAWDSSFQQAMENWAKCRDLEAELAKLKAHAEAMAIWLEVAVTPAALTFDEKWLTAYRRSYPKEDK